MERDSTVLTRLLGVVAGAAVLAGCSGDPAATGQVRPAMGQVAQVGPAAQVMQTGMVGAAGGRVLVPGGPSVDVPAGSVSGDGRLTVRRAGPGHAAPAAPSPFLGVLDAYEISLEGARLTGPVRLTFPVLMQPLPARADADAAAVLGHFDPVSGSWKTVAADYDPDRATITAEVYELAWWNAFGWDFAALRNAVAGAYRQALAATAVAPSCRDESEALATGVRVRSTGSDRMRWCYGLDEGRPVLRVTNTQGYPVSVSLPRAWRSRTMVDGAQLAAGLGAVRTTRGGTETQLLTGGSTLELHPGVLSPGGTVTARSSGAGFLAAALTFARDTFAMTMRGVPGAPVPNAQATTHALDAVLDGDCLRGRTHRAVDGLDAAGAAVLRAHAVAFGCLRPAWQEQYRLDGRTGDFVGVALTWLTTGIPVLIDGVTGIADGVVYTAPDTIRVRAAEPAQQMVMLGDR
ncbi:hypothetical protein KIH74_10705 [Kineosporia sp. J2-2]|uniref:Lipoprotein n=1 Tax=Kineosporia corallincola TaxID=2835133 RepID=A0ABS5TGU8_9ACTN|nr:hypothetical protein [Kineosporia corallincola]MBT0769391.1 hypothetical protein [Kineosporia corallincola]